MKKIILIASLLMAGVAYTKDLICVKALICEKGEDEFSFTIYEPFQDKGLGVRAYKTKYDKGEERFYWEKLRIGQERDGSAFLHTFQSIYDNGDTVKFYFHQYNFTGGVVGGVENLKCRCAE